MPSLGIHSLDCKGGVIVWGGTSLCGKTPLVIVAGTINVGEYTTMLDDFLLPFTEEYYPKGYIYRQENAPAQSSLHSKDWFINN